MAVSKFEVPLARQIIDAVLGKNAAQVPPRLIQIASAEDGMALYQIGSPRLLTPLPVIRWTAAGETPMASLHAQRISAPVYMPD